MIKVHTMKLFTWKTRLKTLIDYAEVGPKTAVEIAQSIIDDIEGIEAQEEKEWLEAQKRHRERNEIWL